MFFSSRLASRRVDHRPPLLTIADTVTLRVEPSLGARNSFYCKMGTFQVARASELASSLATVNWNLAPFHGV